MIRLSAAVTSVFTFSANLRGYELRRDNQTIGTLRQPSMWCPNYVAATRDQNWIIRRSGFWGNHAEIRDAASQQPVAAFKSAWGGKGTLVFADGQTFLSVTRGCWHPVWTVTTDTGQPVLQLHTGEKSVEIDGAVVLPESRLPLLVLFTLYRVRQAEDAAAAAAAATS